MTYKEDETFVTERGQNFYEDRLVIGEGKIFFLSDCRRLVKTQRELKKYTNLQTTSFHTSQTLVFPAG